MDPEVIEVEVERLPRPDEPSRPSRSGPGNRFQSALEPVLAGFVLDVVDFVPVPPVIGFLLGLLVGGALLRHLPLRGGKRVLALLGCGVYCALPLTNVLPLGTVLGAASRFFHGGQKG